MIPFGTSFICAMRQKSKKAKKERKKKIECSSREERKKTYQITWNHLFLPITLSIFRAEICVFLSQNFFFFVIVIYEITMKWTWEDDDDVDEKSEEGWRYRRQQQKKSLECMNINSSSSQVAHESASFIRKSSKISGWNIVVLIRSVTFVLAIIKTHGNQKKKYRNPLNSSLCLTRTQAK